MEKFECYVDLTHVNDSLELESGQEIAVYENDTFVVRLEVCGDVRVIYKDTSYRSVHAMPEELVQIIHDGKVYERDDVYVDMNNWFEVFFDVKTDDGLRWSEWSDVVDCENMNPGEIEEFLKDCMKDYTDDWLNYMKENELFKKMFKHDDEETRHN